MQRYFRAEHTRRLNVLKTTKPGNEWATHTMGASSRDWATVIHYTQFGGAGRIRVPLGFLLMGSLPIFALAAAPFLLGGLMGQPTSFLAYCGGLTAAGRLDGSSGAPVDFFFVALPAVGGFLTLLTGALATFSSARPPLSRPRLADAVCVETARLCSLTYLGFGAALFTVVGTAALIAGMPAGINSFARPLAGMMIVPPLVLGGLAILFLLGRSRWTSSWNTLFALGLIVPGLGGFYLAKLGAERFLRSTDLASGLLSPLGLLTWLALSALAVWLFRYAVHRHYRRCDLTRPAPWVTFFSAGMS